MSNLKHTIHDSGYAYEVDPLTGVQHGLNASYLSALAHFTQAFEAAQKSWEKKVSDEGLAYGNDFHLYSLVIGIDGTPCALVANVDDMAQAYFIDQTGKIPEEDV